MLLEVAYNEQIGEALSMTSSKEKNRERFGGGDKYNARRGEGGACWEKFIALRQTYIRTQVENLLCGVGVCFEEDEVIVHVSSRGKRFKFDAVLGDF
jgi:hypothetical protein